MFTKRETKNVEKNRTKKDWKNKSGIARRRPANAHLMENENSALTPTARMGETAVKCRREKRDDKD